MADQRQKFFTQHHRRMHHHVMRGAAVIIVILIVAGLIYTVINNLPESIGSPTTITISSTPSIISIGGNEYGLELNQSNPKLGTLSVYVSKIPILLNPVINVRLASGSAVKVSATGSQYADMELQPQTIANGSATVVVTPLSQSLEIPADSSSYSILNSSLIGTEAPVTTGT